MNTKIAIFRDYETDAWGFTTGLPKLIGFYQLNYSSDRVGVMFPEDVIVYWRIKKCKTYVTT